MSRIPSDVTKWIRGVFRQCNERITEKLSNNPNIPEGSLDLTRFRCACRDSRSYWTSGIIDKILEEKTLGPDSDDIAQITQVLQKVEAKNPIVVANIRAQLAKLPPRV